uniref:Speckle-type POZ protein (inferred by orthology to a human protein) n=1 Tax=Strongyloides venezuelensis TaxID=75913 RepID=A0A0K0F323_STRVS
MTSNKLSSKTNDQSNSKMIIEKASIMWVIDKFSICKEKPGECKKSPTFNSETDDKVKWSLEMYPRGDANKNKDYISLYVVSEEWKKIDLQMKVGFHVINAAGEKKSLDSEYILKFNKSSGKYGYPKFFKRDFLFDRNNKFIINDTLILGCEIFYYCSSQNTVNTSTISNINEPLNTLVKDFSNLLESSKFFDCIIKTKDYEIKAHKCILASRSELFDSIFKRTNHGYESNIIDINDFSSEVMKKMIKYLYTGKLPDMDDMACEMLKIGNLYKLKQLKSAAEDYLIRNLDFDNVCDYFVESESCSAETLQEWCIRFIYLHPEIVSKSLEWRKVVINHPKLVSKLLAMLSGIN